MADRVARVEIRDIERFGDIFHLTYFPRVTVNDASTSDGSVTNQTVTIAEGQLTINKWKECTVEIIDRAGIQSLFGNPKLLANRFAQEFGPALKEQSDNDLFALHSDLTTNTVGDTTTPEKMSDGLARAAMQKLDEAKIPRANRSYVLSPKAFWDIFGQDKFSAVWSTGLSGSPQVQGPQIVPKLYGASWYESQEIAVSGLLDKNLLIHRSALAMGMQRNVQIVIFAKTKLTTRVNANCLYGIKTIRENHGCVINTVT